MKSSCAPSVFSMKSEALMMASPAATPCPTSRASGRGEGYATQDQKATHDDLLVLGSTGILVSSRAVCGRIWFGSIVIGLRCARALETAPRPWAFGP